MGSGPTPTPDTTYVGVPATVYHLVGLYAGAVLVLLLAFGGSLTARADAAQP